MSKFRLSKLEVSNFNTPQEMYDDYKNRKIEGIHDYQSKMIDLYMENAHSEADIALELPTGERVIIVMGAIYVIKSRVSGTLIQYNSCIA